MKKIFTKVLAALLSVLLASSVLTLPTKAVTYSVTKVVKIGRAHV